MFGEVYSLTEQPHMQNLDPFYTMIRKQKIFSQPCTKWGTYNQKHKCKLKITMHTAFQTIPYAKTINIYGYALLLDSISNQTGSFPCFLETRNDKPGGLFDQTSPTTPPQGTAANITPYRDYCRKIFFGVCLLLTETSQLSNNNAIIIPK